MNQLTAVVPFALIPPELATDLSRALQAPALAMLLGRHAQLATMADEPDARLLPHEAWLARRMGVADGEQAALAHAAMRALGLPPQDGWWFIAQPVHLALARTHMTLGDPRSLRLDEADAGALFNAAKPYFDEVGKTLLYGDANTWFMRADDWRTLRTASPDAAIGENLSDWMPDGPAQRDFRKLQNEVQMLWHASPVNAAREERGLPPVNSFWMWGGSGSAAAVPHLTHSAGPAWLDSLSAPELRLADAATVLASPQDATVLLCDALPAGKAADWSQWLMHLQQLEQQWFAPLLDSLRSGSLRSLELVLTSRTHTLTYTITKGSLRKFWRGPSLQGLIA